MPLQNRRFLLRRVEKMHIQLRQRRRVRVNNVSRCIKKGLLQSYNTTKVCEGLLQLLGVFLRQVLLQHLRKRLHELLCLKSTRGVQQRVFRKTGESTHIHKCEIRYQRLHFANNLRFCRSIEGLKLDIEYCLLFGFLLIKGLISCCASVVTIQSHLLCLLYRGRLSRRCCSCSWHRNLLNVQP